MFEHLRGQFAVALWDERRQRGDPRPRPLRHLPAVLDAADADGGDWLLFASEIKALLASGMVERRPDLRGINHLFTFFALPGPVTCFEGIQALPPGHYLDIQLGGDGESGAGQRAHLLADRFPRPGRRGPPRPAEAWPMSSSDLLLAAVDRRLRADVPVVSYLSGGVDSSIVVAMASQIRGTPIPTFTIQIKAPEARRDRPRPARRRPQHIGTDADRRRLSAPTRCWTPTPS